MVHKEFAQKKKKNNFVCRFTGHTLATSCAPRTSKKDASLAAVLMEHDPALSPAKSAKSTLCRTHIIHPIILALVRETLTGRGMTRSTYLLGRRPVVQPGAGRDARGGESCVGGHGAASAAT
jgi:hypothetical protein